MPVPDPHLRVRGHPAHQDPPVASPGVRRRIQVDPDAPGWGEQLIEPLRAELDRMSQLEAAALEHLPLPAGWIWDAEVDLACMDGTWVIRSTLVPRPDQ